MTQGFLKDLKFHYFDVPRIRRDLTKYRDALENRLRYLSDFEQSPDYITATEEFTPEYTEKLRRFLTADFSRQVYQQRNLIGEIGFKVTRARTMKRFWELYTALEQVHSQVATLNANFDRYLRPLGLHSGPTEEEFSYRKCGKVLYSRNSQLGRQRGYISSREPLYEQEISLVKMHLSKSLGQPSL